MGYYDDRKQVTLRLPKNQYRKLKFAAVYHECTMTDIIIGLLNLAGLTNDDKPFSPLIYEAFDEPERGE